MVPPAPRLAYQLRLPLPEPPGPVPCPPQQPTLAPQHLWATLSLAQQAHVRTALLHILQEVFRDAPHR